MVKSDLSMFMTLIVLTSKSNINKLTRAFGLGFDININKRVHLTEIVVLNYYNFRQVTKQTVFGCTNCFI